MDMEELDGLSSSGRHYAIRGKPIAEALALQQDLRAEILSIYPALEHVTPEIALRRIQNLGPEKIIEKLGKDLPGLIDSVNGDAEIFAATLVLLAYACFYDAGKKDDILRKAKQELGIFPELDDPFTPRQWREALTNFGTSLYNERNPYAVKFGTTASKLFYARILEEFGSASKLFPEMNTLENGAMKFFDAMPLGNFFNFLARNGEREHRYNTVNTGLRNKAREAVTHRCQGFAECLSEVFRLPSHQEYRPLIPTYQGLLEYAIVHYEKACKILQGAAREEALKECSILTSAIYSIGHTKPVDPSVYLG